MAQIEINNADTIEEPIDIKSGEVPVEETENIKSLTQ